jgi:site-specific DNA recombinase
MVGILAVFAQLEREQIKERMKMGREARVKEGKWHGGGSIPTGYDYTKETGLTVNPYEAMIVKEAFELSAKGHSAYTISNLLQKKYPERKWYETTVSYILKNRAYLGYIPFQNDWVKGIHPPIITEELFNAANSRPIDKVRQKNGKHSTGKYTSYLGGLIRCARCGARFAKQPVKSSRNGKVYRYAYYSCYSVSKTNAHLVVDPNCGNKRYHEEELNEIIFNEIRKLQFEEIEEKTDDTDQVEILQGEIKKIEAQVDRLLDLYSVDGISIETLQAKMSALNDKRDRLIGEIEKILSTPKISAADVKEKATAFDKILQRGDFHEIRGAICDLIEEIIIDGDDITIKWAFA